jgi:CheY-like chemotaxis protein
MAETTGINPSGTPSGESFLPDSTILIVDDNQQNVELLQAFLETLPVRILTASDGVEALEMWSGTIRT